ncbi:hypothetical protein Pcinc_037287 [Petrolisthes cinctipes]|uniref:Uncharacterized protein n=1 Tax=Petrolisthes cinctipes TaxID=88211 RepID=A0AAE1BTU9_PETCI|nr:hypothetical protein Pcinc_037287 [Petrolisthes cinctipes]
MKEHCKIMIPDVKFHVCLYASLPANKEDGNDVELWRDLICLSTCVTTDGRKQSEGRKAGWLGEEVGNDRRSRVPVV